MGFNSPYLQATPRRIYRTGRSRVPDRTLPTSAISIAEVAFIAFIAFMVARIESRFPTRVDPSDFSTLEIESVRGMVNLFQNETRPPALVDEENNRLELPRPIYELLVRVATALQEGKVLALVPETQELTTQAAANILGVSRPHLIKLLETGKLAHHKVGAHRRVRMKDLIAFQQARDVERRNSLNDLARKAQEAGLY